MNENKRSSEEREMTQSSTSSSADMRDWEVVESDIEVKDTRNTSFSTVNNAESLSELNPSPSGLFTHNVPVKHSGVEELIVENDRLQHNHSNSSSDIDIIDEFVDYNISNMSICSMDISSCFSDNNDETMLEQSVAMSQTSTETPPSSSAIPKYSSMKEREEIGYFTRMCPQQHAQSSAIHPDERSNPTEEFSADSETVIEAPISSSNSSINPSSSIFDILMNVVGFIINAVMDHFGGRMTSRNKIVICVFLTGVAMYSQQYVQNSFKNKYSLEQMKENMQKLQVENEHLKSKVLAKLESGKLFGELDEEVKELKTENFKLHKAMQKVIHQLEEQTSAIKQGIEVKDNTFKDPYRKEITKLKEQINLLRIDNEELQKQLVRIRYGKFNNHQDRHEYEQENIKPKTPLESSSSTEKKKENYGSMKDSREEVLELRRKLDEEVQKLKIWKESLEDFVKQIVKPHGKGDFLKRKQPEYDGRESLQSDKLDEEKHKHKRHKNKKFYSWTWKQIKNNFKGTLENFPRVSDMISKYVLFDRNKVNGVLDTISHYYNKAHDKTKKILESYSVDEKTQNVKDEIWSLMGEMKNKWITMKDEFLETHFSSNDEDVEENEPVLTESDDVDPSTEKQQIPFTNVESAEENHPFPGEAFEIPFEQDSSSEKISDFSNTDYQENAEEWKENMWNVKEVNELLKEARRRFSHQESNINSWIFERAQHRADLRDNENDAADLNWYLRKNKQSEDVESGFAPDNEMYEENYQSGEREY